MIALPHESEVTSQVLPAKKISDPAVNPANKRRRTATKDTSQTAEKKPLAETETL